MKQALGRFDIEYLEATAKSKIVVDAKTALMTKAEFYDLLDYSSTLPTGTFVGKRWKRQLNEKKGNLVVPSNKWLMGEYAPNPEAGTVDIIWRDIALLDGELP